MPLSKISAESLARFQDSAGKRGHPTLQLAVIWATGEGLTYVFAHNTRPQHSPVPSLAFSLSHALHSHALAQTLAHQRMLSHTHAHIATPTGAQLTCVKHPLAHRPQADKTAGD